MFIPNNKPKRLGSRQGFTLYELIASVFAFGILLTGLISVLGVSIQTMKLSEGASAQKSKSFQLYSQLAGDIILAKKFHSQDPDFLEFSTYDRDGDGKDEYIDYEYFVAPRNEIVRSIYYSATATVVEEVIADSIYDFSFSIESDVVTRTDPVQPRTGLERLLFSRDLNPESLSGGLLSSPSLSLGGPSADLAASAKTILLVTQDSISLSQHESNIKTLLESFGCVVRTIDDSATQSEFDTEFPLCDMIYVPFVIDSAAIGDKIKDTQIGILTESNAICEVLGLGEASSTVVDGHYLELANDANQLAGGNVSGALAMFGNSQSCGTLTSDKNKLSDNIRIVGSTENTTTMSYLETGDKTYISQSSPSSTFGFDEAFASESFAYGWNHVGTKIDVTEAALAKSISIYTRFSNSSLIRFGIYSDANGRPGTLLAQTNYAYGNEFSARWLTMDLQTATSLDAGDYWLVASVYGSVHFYYETGGSARTCYSQTSVWDGMMTGWGTYQDYSYGSKVSMYLTCNVDENVSGRRMFAPWGGSTVDLDELTDDGKSLFESAVQWCATAKATVNESHQSINNRNVVCQYILPTFKTSETDWIATRISMYLRPLHSDSSGNFRITIFEPNDSTQPSSQQLAQSDWIPVSQIDGDHFRWFNVPLDELPIQSTSTGVCIKIETDSSTAGIEVGADSNTPLTNAKLFQSSDGGNVYTRSPSNENARIYLFGRTVTSE